MIQSNPICRLDKKMGREAHAEEEEAVPEARDVGAQSARRQCAVDQDDPAVLKPGDPS